MKSHSGKSVDDDRTDFTFFNPDFLHSYQLAPEVVGSIPTLSLRLINIYL